MRHALVVAVLLLAGLCAWRFGTPHRAPLHRSANAPGRPVDLRAAMAPGRTTLVHYYADWCPGCSKWARTMKAVEAWFDDIHVVYVDIDRLDSEVARRDRIHFVPNFKVYDPRGRLIAEDKAADAWLRREIDRRLAARGVAAGG